MLRNKWLQLLGSYKCQVCLHTCAEKELVKKYNYRSVLHFVPIVA